LDSLFYRFIENNDEGCGWVLKAPYTTGGFSVRYPKNLEAIFNCLFKATHDYFGRIPYMMLQPCMKNKHEYKVVVLHEKPAFVSYNYKNSGSKRVAFSKYPFDDILQFAGIAVARLKKNCPEAITEGLIRVDIFQNKEKQFIVNEFESLDANYQANDGDMTKDSETAEILKIFWFEKFMKFVNKKEN
jgi:hypothetical protein